MPITIFPPIPSAAVVTVLPPNAAQESGGNLALLAIQARVTNALLIKQMLNTTGATPNGFIPVEIPDFLGGL